MGRRSAAGGAGQGRAEWGVVAQQEDSIPSRVSSTFSSPQSHLCLLSIPTCTLPPSPPLGLLCAEAAFCGLVLQGGERAWKGRLVLGAPHREILLMQQTICVNGTWVMVSEGAAFVVAAQSSASLLAVGAFHLSGDFQRFLQAIEPATDQVDSIGPENTTLMDPKFVAVKR